MKKLNVYNVSVLQPDLSILKAQTVEVRDGVITRIRTYTPGEEKVCGQDTEVLDGSGKLLMPGLCDSHMHTGQQLLKGKILDELPMIWTRIMLPFESTLTPEKMQLSAQLAALEMIKSGTTAFVDAGSYYVEAAAEVYLKSGLRGLLSVSTMDDQTLPESIRQNAEPPEASTHRENEENHGKANQKHTYTQRSLLSCSEKLILSVADHAKERETLLQAHMNEYPNEINGSLQKYQLRPLEYLDRLGVLDEHFLAVHCILLSETEKELLKERKVKVCHCPFSNCGKGVPETPSLLERKIAVGLGTDGAAHGG